MCATHQQAGRSLAGSILSNRCPRCREGKLFTHPNPYDLRTTMRMPAACPVCGQPFELQTGFYFGTGYVSYGIVVMACALSFILWWLTIGFSLYDNRLYWWLGINAVLMFLIQPLIQRLSRSLWIAFFVRYDQDWRHTLPSTTGQ